MSSNKKLREENKTLLISSQGRGGGGEVYVYTINLLEKMSNSTESISTHKVLQCVTFPPRGFSIGIFGKRSTPWIYSVPTIESQILIMYIVTQLFHFPLKHLGFPKLASEIFVCSLFPHLRFLYLIILSSFILYFMFLIH